MLDDQKQKRLYVMLIFSYCKNSTAMQADTKGGKKTAAGQNITKFTTFLKTDTKILVAKPKRKSSPAKNYKQEQKHYSKFGSSPPISNMNQLETPAYHWTGTLVLTPFLVEMELKKVKHILPPAPGHIQISSRC